jgi:hypothetical protein
MKFLITDLGKGVYGNNDVPFIDDNLLDVGDKNFEHDQGTPSDTWIITHDLNKYPSVTVINSAKSEVNGTVEFINKNKIIITFNGAFTGTATLN